MIIQVLADSFIDGTRFRSPSMSFDLSFKPSFAIYSAPFITCFDTTHAIIVYIPEKVSTKSYGIITAKELLLTLLTDITIIDIPHETALIALHSKINDIEDALQYYTAIHHNLNAIARKLTLLCLNH